MIIKQHDTNIRFNYTPTINGKPLTSDQLEGASVSWLIKGSALNYKRAAEITPEGTFTYDPIDADVAFDGDFYIEWELKDQLGKLLTFPNDGYYQLKIVPDLG
jgi:hypothetical protein